MNCPADSKTKLRKHWFQYLHQLDSPEKLNVCLCMCKCMYVF